MKQNLLFFLLGMLISLSPTYNFNHATNLIIKDWNGDITITRNESQAQAVVIEAHGGIIDQDDRIISCKSHDYVGTLSASINQPYLILCIKSDSHRIVLDRVKVGSTVIINNKGDIELNEGAMMAASVHTESGRILITPRENDDYYGISAFTKSGQIKIHHANRLKNLFARTASGLLFKNGEVQKKKHISQSSRSASSLFMFADSGNILIEDN